MENKSAQLLNLPGRLRFFPTAATDQRWVSALIHRLHPVTCGRELIRLGPERDGGYLVPDDLDGIESCFSPGVSNMSDFELDCARRGMKVFMADASVDAPAISHSQFHFVKRHVGAATQGESISLEEWIETSDAGSGADCLLQMDIEGCEYEALLSLPIAVQRRFRIIVVEFHFLDRLFCEPMFALYARAFEKLLTTHSCVHIHPNNICPAVTVGELEIPQIAEFTFLRNDRVENAQFATTFPHPLDRDNTSNHPLHLSTSCYRTM
jgi:hypothetical protein